jgi:L-amino acid N-acyltransferase YncA
MLLLRPAIAEDIPALIDFMLEHGPNDWNYLPEEGLREHLEGIRTGQVQGVVATEAGEVLGLMTFETGTFYPEYEANPEAMHGYVAEGVVHRQRVGQGLGLELLQRVVGTLAASGIRHIYAKRHEENPFSSRLLQKAGFNEVATFADPAIRTTGSRRTTVCRFVVG